MAPREPLLAGKPFPLKAQLLLDGKPLPVERIKASMRITSPAIDFRKFFDSYKADPVKLKQAKERMRKLGLGSEEELKMYLLSMDREAVAKCTKTRASTTKLYPHGLSLTGELLLQIPGVHRLDLHIAASTGNNQHIVRTRSLNVLVLNA